MSVDLPDPEGPIIAMISPRWMLQVTPRKASICTSPTWQHIRRSRATITSSDMLAPPAPERAAWTALIGRIQDNRITFLYIATRKHAHGIRRRSKTDIFLNSLPIHQ